MPVPVPEATFTASVATGSTTVFPYGFMIASEDDLGVMLDGVLQTTGYTVSGVGNPEGGDVTFSVAPAADVRVVRFLNPILNRETNYQQFGDFNNTTVNLDFDRLWLAMQYLSQNTSRSLKLPVDTADNQEITQTPAERANKGLRFDDDGNLTLSAYDPDGAQESAASAVSAAQDAALAAQAAAVAAEGIVDSFGNGGVLDIEFGGTGASTASSARANLGLGSAAVLDTSQIAEYVQGTPAGAVAHFAMTSAPTGWLKANGAAISRTTYAELFAAIGTTFGVGDGSATFNLPDLRGEFLRGWDDGRGVDAGRIFGGPQADAFQGHRLGHPEDNAFTLGANAIENTGASGSPTADVTRINVSKNSGVGHKKLVPVTDGTNGTPRVANETRARNMALLACIKF